LHFQLERVILCIFFNQKYPSLHFLKSCSKVIITTIKYYLRQEKKWIFSWVAISVSTGRWGWLTLSEWQNRNTFLTHWNPSLNDWFNTYDLCWACCFSNSGNKRIENKVIFGCMYALTFKTYHQVWSVVLFHKQSFQLGLHPYLNHTGVQSQTGQPWIQWCIDSGNADAWSTPL